MPPGLVDEGFCLLHYTLHIEEECAAIRRQTTLLTLMNTRENMDRSAMRQSAMKRFA